MPAQPPQDKPLRLPVPHDPGAAQDRPDTRGQVEGNCQLSRSLFRIDIDVPLGEGDEEGLKQLPHLPAQVEHVNKHQPGHPADNASKEGHPICRALHPGRGVGTDDSIHMGFPEHL